MSATLQQHSISAAPVLYVALELGWSTWELSFSVGFGQKARRRKIAARCVDQLGEEIAQAKKRFKLAPETKVVSCYEAGRDGFWLDRCLRHHGVANVVVDSSSIEVKRRRRHAKSDGLDVAKLLSMLIRYDQGEEKVWSVVRVPSASEEDSRQLHRELRTLKTDRTRYVNRLKGLLASHGLVVEKVDRHFPDRLSGLRLWDGSCVPEALRDRLLRDFERLQLTHEQIRTLERKRAEQLRESSEPQVKQVREMMKLHGIGAETGWLYAMELFSWRKFRNRRELGSLCGLTPTPYNSGQSEREQGISKAGNRWIRATAIEVAWMWLRYQPQSGLSRWYQRRFGHGSKRVRKIGIVALARKLLIALWRYVESGEIPEGAQLCDWRSKVRVRQVSLKAS